MNNDLFLNEFPEVEIGAESQPQSSTTMIQHQPITSDMNANTNYIGIIGIVVGILIVFFIFISRFKKSHQQVEQNYVKENNRPVRKTVTVKNKSKTDNLSVPDNIEDCIIDFLDRTK